MTLVSAEDIVLYGDRALEAGPLTQSPSYRADTEEAIYIPHKPLNFRHRLSNTLSRLREPSLKCERNLGWNIEWAVAYFVDRLETTLSDAAESFRDIRIRAATLESEGLIQEIPYRIFDKLDQVLFASHLKDAVFLNIKGLGSDVSGATYTHSWGPNIEVKRISIILNGGALQYAKARDVVAMLIHHMIHAYFLVACGPQKEEDVDYRCLDHGVHFGAIMLAIKKLSAIHGKELTPLDFGHGSAAIRYRAEEYYHPRMKQIIEQEDEEKWYCSHCHCNVEAIPERHIDKWYTRVCKPMFDQPRSVRTADVTVYNDRRHEFGVIRRARLPPAAESIEFIFKERPVYVDGKKINDIPSIRYAFDKAKSRFLKVHKSVSEKTFLRFMEFLHTGSYRPDPYPFAAAASSLGINRKGPPIIKPQGTSTEAYLLTDVQFFKLGSLMGFDECKRYALKRMNAYGVLYEDAVAVLREIYSGHEPDPELRKWAREFLVQAPTTSSPEHSTTRFPFNAVDPPNLIKLESEQGAYRTRFLDAIDASGALENEVNKARKELQAAGWFGGRTCLVPHVSPGLFASSLPLRYASKPLLDFDFAQRSPLPRSSTDPSSLQIPSSWLGITSPPIASSLAPLALEGLRDLERRKQFLHYERQKVRDLERDLLNDVEKEKVRVLERERAREKEKAKEMAARELKAEVQAAKALGKFYMRGLGGDASGDERY
ncbi:hypothetical protein N0V83_010495 [Neocucurbitaria cava]|uniref:SprT-like domain-containing protein n=1 Tax=Neocucurbitaria cava TaxID=798079 RepID=A0A9W8XXM1_9PLEO|nr:hypothetical protein N0V83_010495 [Neocucurbitaria cava]